MQLLACLTSYMKVSGSSPGFLRQEALRYTVSLHPGV